MVLIQIFPAGGAAIVAVTPGTTNSTGLLGVRQNNASVSGHVYSDTNSNSVFDASDSGVAGVTVFLDANHNQHIDTGELTAVTDTTGNYLFAAGPPNKAYSVRPALAEGWTWNDAQDLVFSFGPGSSISDMDFSVTRPPTPPANFITNVPPTANFAAGLAVIVGSNGVVSFKGVADPSPADVAAGFKYSYDFNNGGSFDITDSTSPTATVPVANLSTVSLHTIRGRIKDKDDGFTDYTTTIQVNAAPASASIAGTAFNDANGNGKRNTGETPISARKMYLDKNRNGVLDPGETTIASGSGGTYNFTGLTAGTYRIRDVLPSGWRRTNPTAGYYDVTVSAGQVVTGKDFAETNKGPISGILFKDANSNGKQDAGEAALLGWVRGWHNTRLQGKPVWHDVCGRHQ